MAFKCWDVVTEMSKDCDKDDIEYEQGRTMYALVNAASKWPYVRQCVPVARIYDPYKWVNFSTPVQTGRAYG